MNPNPISCVNCQAVTTNDGRTIWVCESCGEENTPAVDTTPVESQIPDATAAQAAISDAVASVAPATAIPPVPPVTPVSYAAPAVSGMQTIPEVPAAAVVEPVTPPEPVVVNPVLAPKKPSV